MEPLIGVVVIYLASGSRMVTLHIYILNQNRHKTNKHTELSKQTKMGNNENTPV